MNSENWSDLSLYVHFLPSLISPDEFSNDLVVMIDLLRASTTILHALENGAKEIFPCETVNQAFQRKESLAQKSVLLGGERGGEMISGFDLDNSPFSYEKEIVMNKTILFTTTNGTKALNHANQARRILIGSFCNLNAICSELIKEQGRVHLLCAGTNGEISSEDVLCAGAMISDMTKRNSGTKNLILNDQAWIAKAFFDSLNTNELENAVKNSHGGQNLLKLGMDRDISRACQLNRYQSTPEYFSSTKCIHIPKEV